MSPWPCISACPKLLDGRRGRTIRPCCAEPLLHSLDMPTRRLVAQGPLEGPPLAKARRDLRHGTQKEGCHDRASKKGWGALCEGKPTIGLWSEEESGLHINCLEMLAVCHACQFFLPDIRGHHVLVHSDCRSVVSFINPQDGLVSKRLCALANNLLVWASDKSALTEGDACAMQNEPRSRHVVKEQHLLRGMDSRSWFRKSGKSLAELE